MCRFPEITERIFCLVATLLFSLNGVVAQQNAGALNGHIVDELGGVIVVARLTIVDSKGVERTATTNDRGSFLIDGLAAGKYTVRVAAAGFAPYENAEVVISIGQRAVLNITLNVAAVKGEITVSTDSSSLSTSPDKTTSTIVVKGKELEALPDDPDD